MPGPRGPGILPAACNSQVSREERGRPIRRCHPVNAISLTNLNISLYSNPLAFIFPQLSATWNILLEDRKHCEFVIVVFSIAWRCDQGR